MFKKKEEKPKADEAKKTAEAQVTAENPAADKTPSAEKPEEKPAEGQPKDNSQEGQSAGQSDNPDDQTTPPPAEPDWKTLYAVTLADFDNYKKRAARDREDVYRYAESDILKDVLPVVDNLALALANAKDKEDAFVKGVQLVYDSLLKALADHGAKPMPDLIGKELDPNFHEAIATLPSADVEEGKISTVVKTGWTLNDKLLRAAQVVVSAGKPEA